MDQNYVIEVLQLGFVHKRLRRRSELQSFRAVNDLPIPNWMRGPISSLIGSEPAV